MKNDCHLNKTSIKVGDHVGHDKPIGESGNTGNAKDINPIYNHVHIEASRDGKFYGGTKRVDAEIFMKTKFDGTIKGSPI